MARSYPIWNNVEACIYGSSKSWGARDTCNVNVNVGSSATYSNHFVNHTEEAATHQIVQEPKGSGRSTGRRAAANLAPSLTFLTKNISEKYSFAVKDIVLQ